MKFISVIQHTQSEWLGLIEDHLEGRNIRFGYSRPFTVGGQLPDPNVMGDGLILLGGGPWGTAGSRNLPTLEQEIKLARTCLMLELPVIGIGTGAQVLALAADGRVETGPLIFNVSTAFRVADNALKGFLPPQFPNVIYMRDVPVPPSYADALAVDGDNNPTIWQIGANAFGFSGHPGIKRAMVEDLMMEFPEDEPAGSTNALDELTVRRRDIEDALVLIMTGLIQATGWMRTDETPS